MCHKFSLIALIGILVVFSLASAETNVKQCKDTTKPTPLMVDIKGCTQIPCDVYKGQTTVVQVHFVSTKDNIHKLTAKCYATALGITVPYELPDDVADVCQNLLYEAMCPLYATEDVVYDFQFYVDQYYPEIPATIELNLVDKDNEVITCFSASIRVRKGTATNNVNGLEAAEPFLFKNNIKNTFHLI
ncbi:NPC intracellular cholesterol transporter 2 isoform X1 [Bactrocera dorsalis]|uniref:NPC intracellular cholesterol transporter 2 isoform X1 n=1 Tax=Bactrocera dorsalis TaxID=27457 RepID=A0ABM3J8U5_BACDO|nr:NPC intracellular cholesterol transporter 2 isoform X1 [Bactrocera dorsalis]